MVDTLACFGRPASTSASGSISCDAPPRVQPLVRAEIVEDARPQRRHENRVEVKAERLAEKWARSRVASPGERRSELGRGR
jgi:hypothetical protein